MPMNAELPITEGLKLPPAIRLQMVQQAAAGYPEEVCGVLVGQGRSVERVYPAQNAAEPAERMKRYVLDPHDVLRIDREAASAGLEIVGCYHSHPDHDAVPSETDRSLAWEVLIYVIIPVAAAGVGVLRAWQLRADRHFIEIAVME